MATVLAISSASSQSETEASAAKNSFELLAKHVREDEDTTLRVSCADGSDEIVLPPEAAKNLLAMLRMMAKGDNVAVTAIDAELTTRQAAQILNVSRPHLVKLLDSGEIPCRMVGSHRRIRRDDVMQYKAVLREKREAILAQMIADAQEWGLYD